MFSKNPSFPLTNRPTIIFKTVMYHVIMCVV